MKIKHFTSSRKRYKNSLNSENKENVNESFAKAELGALNTALDMPVRSDELHYQFLKQLQELSLTYKFIMIYKSITASLK